MFERSKNDTNKAVRTQNVRDEPMLKVCCKKDFMSKPTQEQYRVFNVIFVCGFSR